MAKPVRVIYGKAHVEYNFLWEASEGVENVIERENANNLLAFQLVKCKPH